MGNTALTNNNDNGTKNKRKNNKLVVLKNRFAVISNHRRRSFLPQSSPENTVLIKEEEEEEEEQDGDLHFQFMPPNDQTMHPDLQHEEQQQVSPSQQKRVKVAVSANGGQQQPRSKLEDASNATASTRTVKNNKTEKTSVTTKKSRSSNRRRNNNNNQEPVVPAIVRYIPPYLRPYVHPCQGDFCVSRHFHPQLIVQLMAEGFLPMCSHDEILLPKLHEERCCILLQQNKDNSNNNNGSLHTGKSTRKKAKNYALTYNQAWGDVVEGCQEQHGNHCWLYPRLVESFQAIHRAGCQGQPFLATIMDNTSNNNNEPSQFPVRLHSVELWSLPKSKTNNNANKGSNNKNGKKKKDQPSDKEQERQVEEEEEERQLRLVAGEIGYSVGGIYTSLTGFTKESSAGSIQLAALGSALKLQGFCVWDLGMMMDYKQNLGAIGQERSQFVRLVHEHRWRTECELAPPPLSTLTDDERNDADHADFGRNARTLIDEALALAHGSASGGAND